MHKSLFYSFIRKQCVVRAIKHLGNPLSIGEIATFNGWTSVKTHRTLRTMFDEKIVKFVCFEEAAERSINNSCYELLDESLIKPTIRWKALQLLRQKPFTIQDLCEELNLQYTSAANVINFLRIIFLMKAEKRHNGIIQKGRRIRLAHQVIGIKPDFAKADRGAAAMLTERLRF